MSKSTADILRQAKALIEDEAHWCRGVGSRNKEGAPVLITSMDAYSWCAMGAVNLVRGRNSTPYNLLIEVAFGLFGMTPTAVNDTLNHAAVMQMYDEAIRRAEEKGDA